MKKKPWSVEILFILVVAACLTWSLRDSGQAPQVEETSQMMGKAPLPKQVPGRQQWGDHYAIAQKYLKEGDLAAAERELLSAEKIALRMPAGDKSLAETLDDLGLVYFKLGKLELAEQSQGRAVAALLLAGGPQDPELETYIERYGWAHDEAEPSESETLRIESPINFLAIYSPQFPSQKFTEELARLESDYQKMGNTGALRVIARLRSHK